MWPGLRGLSPGDPWVLWSKEDVSMKPSHIQKPGFSKKPGFHARFLVVLLAPLFLLGCRRTADAPAGKEYDIKGKVVSIAPDKKGVTLDHEAIPGLMGAMKMEFPVESPEV